MKLILLNWTWLRVWTSHGCTCFMSFSLHFYKTTFGPVFLDIRSPWGSPWDLVTAMAMESIRLWLALTPKQFEDLDEGKEIQPDEYSKRFGLRKDPSAAVERAQYFNDWTPEGPKGEGVPKTMFWWKSNWLLLDIFRSLRLGFFWNISPTNIVGKGRCEPKNMMRLETYSINSDQKPWTLFKGAYIIDCRVWIFDALWAGL